jgi:ribose transport system substrate-binding protein
MINFVEGASTAKERATGYEREISQYKEIIMHPTVYTQGTTADAYEATKNVLKKYPELKGIVAANQQVTDAVCEAVEEMGLQSQVSVVGFDSSQTIIYALERDIIDAIIVQKPFNMGYLAVKNGLQAYRGKKIPEYVDTGYKLINKETLYLTENQKLLYPIIK